MAEAAEAAKPAKPAKPANASAAPRLPPWEPASLILHWPATRDAANLSLPRLHRRRRGLPVQGTPAQRAEPARARRLLQLLPAAEPHQLAGVLELADFSWSRANHTGAAFLALESATGPACPDALALAVTATALLTCLLTLVCVWLLARRAGLPVLLARLPALRPAKQLVELPQAEVPHAAALAPASDKV